VNRVGHAAAPRLGPITFVGEIAVKRGDVLEPGIALPLAIDEVEMRVDDRLAQPVSLL
jgi:hypothetical protein